jgi:hypothetical protein
MSNKKSTVYDPAEDTFCKETIAKACKITTHMYRLKGQCEVVKERPVLNDEVFKTVIMKQLKRVDSLSPMYLEKIQVSCFLMLPEMVKQMNSLIETTINEAINNEQQEMTVLVNSAKKTLVNNFRITKDVSRDSNHYKIYKDHEQYVNNTIDAHRLVEHHKNEVRKSQKAQKKPQNDMQVDNTMSKEDVTKIVREQVTILMNKNNINAGNVSKSKKLKKQNSVIIVSEKKPETPRKQKQTQKPKQKPKKDNKFFREGKQQQNK